MSDDKKIENVAIDADNHVADPVPDHEFDTSQLPGGWMYKVFSIGLGKTWYASPSFQLFMISMVCFLCPGMFNALGGLGGGGQVDSNAQTKAATALYSTFSVVGFFSGTFTNRLGTRFAVAFGGLGYALYAASFLSYNHNSNEGFVIFAGAFLGVCAGLLWCGQGAIMMSYPTEKNKGKYISWFWIIFNFGAVLGSLIPLGQSINNPEQQAANDGTYVAFIVLMALGLVLALFLCNGNQVIRDDGSKVIMMKNPTWQTEIFGLWETLKTYPAVILLFPMFFASNSFYTYQPNGFNGQHFNFRGRSLNGLLYWLAQIIGAMINGYALDSPRFKRSTRARASFVVLFILTFVIWGGGYAFQKDSPDRYTTSEDKQWIKDNRIDWTNARFIGPMFLYFFYGFYDAIWQTTIYWYMGALSNSGRTAANLAGFYKGIQSAGAAVFFALDTAKLEYTTMFYVTWGLLAVSLVIGAPLILFKIQDHVTLAEDLQHVDETAEDVVAFSEKPVA
ncbi:hypothetical protein VHEMI09465 [[Torrubiella] hemipterigena]|uniref:DUF895 domain membrane protein n=1 Tax=[Torrubiella] hemipterigena TaxID=1531966 RepID=A0A0A1TQ24_9HYPO|nr:hypothetical protein VHEMI09465 [[Torrubiella] hemipterigena]